MPTPIRGGDNKQVSVTAGQRPVVTVITTQSDMYNCLNCTLFMFLINAKVLKPVEIFYCYCRKYRVLLYFDPRCS